MNREQIKKTLDSDSGKELKKFLVKELLNLKSIDNVKDYSKGVDQAIELKACRKAYKKLQEILSEIINIESIKEIEIEQGNDYGIDEKYRI